MVDNYTTHNFLISFIDEYRQLPCLWQVKSADYKNKKLKKQAMEHLVAFYKPVCPGANFDYVRRKINSIRSAYRREVKKIEESTQSGAAAENVHVPRLWYFYSSEVPGRHVGIEAVNFHAAFDFGRGLSVCRSKPG